MASRRDRRLDSAPPPFDDDEVARLLESAGPRPPVPAQDLEAIAAAARAAWEARAARRAAAVGRRRALLPLAMAASLLAVVSAAAWWLAQRADPARPLVASVEALTGAVALEIEGAAARQLAVGDAIPARAAVRTGGGGGDRAVARGEPGRVALRLANGVVLRLDAQSSLKLGSATALELVAGAVYADTGAAASPIAELEVSTPMGVARDLGTRFAVRLSGRKPDLELHVLVRDGAVEVDRDGESWVAGAGQELVLHERGVFERREIPAYGPDWEWVVAAGAGFAIGGRTPGELLAWMASETGWLVRFEDGAVEQTARTIAFQAGDSLVTIERPEQGLAVLPTAGLEGELDDGTLLVRRVR